MTRRPIPSRSELAQADRRQKAPRGEVGWQHPDLEHVPTAPELFARGLAQPAGTAYRISPEGYRLIHDAMTRNAALLRADPDLRARVERDAVARGRVDRERLEG